MRAVKAARDLSEFSSRLVERISELLPESVADSSAEYLRKDARQPVLDLVAAALCALCTEQPNDRPEVFTVFWMLKYMGTRECLLQELDDYFSREYHGLPSGGVKRVSADKITPPPGKPTATGRSRLSFGPPPDTGGVSPTSNGISTDPVVAPAAAGNDAPHPGPRDKEEDDEEAREAMDQVVPLDRGPRVSIQAMQPNHSVRQSLRRGSLAARRSETVGSVCGASVAPPRHEVLRLLKAVPTMARFTEEDLDRVADIIKPCRYAPGETIAPAGEVSQALHIITEGSGTLSELQVIGELGKGDFFGEQALLAGNQAPSVKQVQALDGGLQAISICKDSFEALKIIRQVERRAKMTNSVQKEENVTLDFAKDALSKGDLCPVCGHKLVKDYEQTHVDRTMIKEAIRNNDVLNEVMCLTTEQWDMIADSVHLIEVPSSMEVFRKGDIGNAFFIVQQGLLNIKLEGRGEIHFRLGDSFGELALMYDEPRSATVTSLTDSTRLWVMPRQPFRAICSVSAKQRLTEFANLLRLVPALASSIDASHFELLAGVVEETVFVHRDEICVEGEDDGVLFMMYDGEARVIGTETHIKKGDFVGERQLIDQISADKTVIVVSEVAKVLILDRRSYEIALDASDAMKAKRKSMKAVKDTQDALDIAHHGSFKKQVQRVMTRLRSLTLFTDGGKTVSQVRPKSTPTLERCEVVGKLGEGSFGLVLLVEDRETKQEFALKCLSKEQLNYEKRVDMVQNERYVMMQLHSDFIVRLHRTYEDSIYYYLLLELATGGELFDVYTSRNLWGLIPYARFYIASVALGLSHMHAKRVVWRDLKLENCLVDGKGNLKLSDLGIAKLVIGRTYTVCGTADYFAPESLRQLGHNRAADWWACGVLLFIMMAGRSPFDAPEVSQIYKNIIKGMAKVDFPSSCPIDCANVIKALCKKKPEDRVTMQKGGVHNLMEMSFFKEFSWEDLSNRSMVPPYVPESSDYAQAAARRMEGTKLPLDKETLREWKPDERTEASTLCNETKEAAA
mmetsp:Transcript_138404/g.254614  ORF Transcript_138404/g.254614 Transcript_138404/m.254614 type:complete len:1021 (-) Transcript_138404:135-3197(-)